MVKGATLDPIQGQSPGPYYPFLPVGIESKESTDDMGQVSHSTFSVCLVHKTKW